MTEPSIRRCRPEDLDALYAICLRTGAAGGDATDLMHDQRLLGDLFVAPYAVLEPEHCFVLDDGTGTVGGYVVGARDTVAFEQRCEAEWWPGARQRHPGPPDRGILDDLFVAVLHARPPVDAGWLTSFPSHLHIDLLPPFQSGGWGRRLMETLFDALRADGSPGVHLGVATANTRAVGFYRHLGFTQLHTDDITLTLGLPLR